MVQSCSKSRSEWLDPCQEAATRSIQCLNRNGGDRAMCQEYFQYVLLHSKNPLLGLEADQIRRAYRDCKKEWVSSLKMATSCGHYDRKLTARQINKRKSEKGGGLFG